MDTNRLPAPNPPDLADDGPATIEQAAALTFDALPVEMPDRARFMDQAATAFVCVRVGAAMLTKDPAELAAALKMQGKAGIFELLEEMNANREWFAGFVKLLDAVEARVFVAPSRLAAEMEARP